MTLLNMPKLIVELEAAGLPACIVNINNTVAASYIDTSQCTPQQIPAIQAILAAHDGSVPLGEANLVALWNIKLTATSGGALSGLQRYFLSILLKLHTDMQAATDITTTLNDIVPLVAANTTQAAIFTNYRTLLGLGGAVSGMTAAQKGNLLVLGLEWAAAGLAVANALNQ